MPFLIRPAEERDLPQLKGFAARVYFINLPRETDLLRQNLQLSMKSFAGEVKKGDGLYIFSIEDTETGDAVGTSCLIERHGTREAPHTFFELKRRDVYSKTLKGGFTHEVLELGFDSDGPSEIGGLIVDPSYRKHPDKVGLQISMIRYLFIRSHRARFRDQVLAELMARVSDEGLNALWEEVGRKFINLDYPTADRLSRTNKEFILSLFPEGPIYLCMLSPEAREAIGSVHKNTEPARKFLESIGFTYRNRIDPFDGGPHYRAETDQIKPVAATIAVKTIEAGDVTNGANALVAVGDGAAFRAAAGPAVVSGDSVLISTGLQTLLAPEMGEVVHVLPLA